MIERGSSHCYGKIREQSVREPEELTDMGWQKAERGESWGWD